MLIPTMEINSLLIQKLFSLIFAHVCARLTFVVQFFIEDVLILRLSAVRVLPPFLFCRNVVLKLQIVNRIFILFSEI